MLLAALAEGETTLTGALLSDDTTVMAEGLRRLGFVLSQDPSRSEISVHGLGGTIPARSARISVGLAGTAARFLAALCGASPSGRFEIDGVAQMRRRPMGSLLEALETLGARIESAGGFLPATVHASGLSGGEVTLDATASSQLLSALLMVAPLARKPVTLHLTDPGYRREYVAMTSRMMEQFGQGPTISSGDGTIVRPPHGGRYVSPGGLYRIEPDASAASYFLALPLVAGGVTRLPGLNPTSLQGDMAFANRLRAAGATIEHVGGGVVCGFERGSPRVAVQDDFHAISDTFLTLAAIAPLLNGVTRIWGIAHTRLQETDRVAGVARELRKLGQHVVEEPGAIEIHPRPLVSGVEIETYGDHRFAMSFAILGCHDLHGNGAPWLSIRNPGCCAKTFPRFFETLERAQAETRFA
jgi:3-phosphoshikimate 1-carboxyvinyltransferase